MFKWRAMIATTIDNLFPNRSARETHVVVVKRAVFLFTLSVLFSKDVQSTSLRANGTRDGYARSHGYATAHQASTGHRQTGVQMTSALRSMWANT